jgi:cyclic pyranopterin phosphate synthase
MNPLAIISSNLQYRHMRLRSTAIHAMRQATSKHASFQNLKQGFVNLDTLLARGRHSLAAHLPGLIQPQPALLTVAITARCNLRCIGCRYGRDFMPNQQLPLGTVENLLVDAREAGFQTVRLYGGEPLLHRDLPRMVSAACRLGIRPYVTTNGILLADKIGALYEAGLRALTIGFYGTNTAYDEYVQRRAAYANLENGVAAVRDRYGMDIQIQINFLLTTLSCSVSAVEEAIQFAERHRTRFQVDIAHYSLPYFTEGIDHQLQFATKYRDNLETVTKELLRFKDRRPDLYPESHASIRSIPDWAIKGPAMRVPCTAYRMIWVGADGTVQLCYVTFNLGNLHKTRLKDMLFTEAHKQASRDAFALNCPNCHCHRDERIRSHAASQQTYRQ